VRISIHIDPHHYLTHSIIMSLRDFVASGGCDASQSSNPLAQFADGVVDAAKSSESARFGGQLPPSHHQQQLPPGSQMGPEELAGVDDMDRLMSALHLDPGTVLDEEDLLPEGGGFPALDWAANFMPGSAVRAARARSLG